ncbi:MAG: proton-conducting transporter membrane subunit [Planctomycetota bacterium]|nr:proton-conducting transporter membrane subunit [Planctomycetota bacterium]MDA1141748.1 proton-conducting transporter membrane subunit [Planctomycetota bacterium]
MWEIERLFQVLGMIVLVCPALLLAAIGLFSLLDRPLGERYTGRLTSATLSIGLLAALGILALMLFHGPRRVPVALPDWVSVPIANVHFQLRFDFDRLSVPLVILSLVFCGTIGAFASRYLHREPGFNRFFILFAVFTFGMVLTSVAATIELLFIGWELVGLSSALLIGFFHERAAPVQNGLRVWAIYRISDAAFLAAAIALHYFSGHGDFDSLMGIGPWPEGVATLTSDQALVVGLLLLVAAAGKSGLVPFSGWLPRAMEGPTPSSAVFYGSLSVHLGAFLLLRVSPILDRSLWLSGAVVFLGLATALTAATSARAQTDIKCALAFSSLTQVGIIIAEIGFGLRYVALIHILGHACMRTLQLLRAPSLLHDYHSLENAIGGHLPHGLNGNGGTRSKRYPWLYIFAFERGFLDSLLDNFLVYPFQKLFQMCDDVERRWIAFLSGNGRSSPPVTDEEAQP